MSHHGAPLFFSPKGGVRDVGFLMMLYQGMVVSAGAVAYTTPEWYISIKEALSKAERIVYLCFGLLGTVHVKSYCYTLARPRLWVKMFVKSLAYASIHHRMREHLLHCNSCHISALAGARAGRCGFTWDKVLHQAYRRGLGPIILAYKKTMGILKACNEYNDPRLFSGLGNGHMIWGTLTSSKMGMSFREFSSIPVCIRELGDRILFDIERETILRESVTFSGQGPSSSTPHSGMMLPAFLQASSSSSSSSFSATNTPMTGGSHPRWSDAHAKREYSQGKRGRGLSPISNSREGKRSRHLFAGNPGPVADMNAVNSASPPRSDNLRTKQERSHPAGFIVQTASESQSTTSVMTGRGYPTHQSGKGCKTMWEGGSDGKFSSSDLFKTPCVKTDDGIVDISDPSSSNGSIAGTWSGIPTPDSFTRRLLQDFDCGPLLGGK